MRVTKQMANNVSGLLIAGGVAVCLWSLWCFPRALVDFQLASLFIVTVFFSSALQVQLPNTKIHLSVSDALIFLSLLLYGWQIATLLAAAEACYGSLQLRRKGVNVKSRTIALNIGLASVAACLTAMTASYFFTPPAQLIQTGAVKDFAGPVALVVLAQFLFSSAAVGFFAAQRSNKPFGEVWFESCTATLVMYIAGAVFACLLLKAGARFDLFLLLGSLLVVIVTYMTYRHYVDDIKRKAVQAEQAERDRAEQAERHIEELNHHIAEQERISQALRESKERFRHAAFHDSLTDLPNRNLFVETLKELIDKSRQDPAQSFSVLVLDLNRFKTVNDSLGHQVGDTLLRMVAQRLRRVIRQNDTLARFSGDEFGLILPGITELPELEHLVERLTKAIGTPFIVQGRHLFTSFASGIALHRADYANPEDLLRDAGLALYAAKEKRREYAAFDPLMHTKAVNRLELETDLRQAVEREEFLVYYQPIVALHDGTLAGFEALMRWRHPQRGLVSPAEFIPLSEDTGLIIPMTLWMLRETCRQMGRWSWVAPSYQNLTLSVNLSSRHFAQPDLAQQVQDILTETGFAAHRLKVEITESILMENAQQTVELLLQLKEIGVQVSIDDFGTGYSSLSYLHRFPIDTLKIDRSFVNTMGDGNEKREIVQTIIALAKNLSMEVVAEGIETAEQCQRLRNLACEYGQGFLFSRPLPHEEILPLLQAQKTWTTNWPMAASEVIPFPVPADKTRRRAGESHHYGLIS